MINKAIKIANMISSDYKHRLCAVITDKKGKILSVGTNSYTKTHPIQHYYAKCCGNEERIYLHAEMSAIVSLPYNSKPHAIFIARVNGSGKSMLAKPCKICKHAINDTGIEKIDYTI